MNLSRLCCLLFLAAWLSGCATLKGTFNSGLYISPGGEFLVKSPDLLDMSVVDGQVGDGKYFVDFTVGKGFWMADGYYSVEWYKLDKPSLTNKEFLETTKSFMPSYVKNTFGALFGIMQEKEVNINGRAGYQVTAQGKKDGILAYLVATSINFDNRVAIGIVAVSRENNKAIATDGTPEKVVPWEQYRTFIESIKKQH